MSTARIDELTAKFDENPRRYFAPLANEYRKAGELAQAIALCREHLPKQPGHMSGHIVFGQALYEAGDLSEAQTVFQAALDLDPENLIALRHLGDIARSRGDDPLARRWYERVLDADPRNDDIAALLSSLTARLTPPHSFTPISSPRVVTELPPLDLDALSDTDDADDPFSAPDSPAWHTPSFLQASQTPRTNATGLDDAVDALHATDEPEVTDATYGSKATGAPAFVSATHEPDAADEAHAAHAADATTLLDAVDSAADSAAVEEARELSASTSDADDLLDLDFVAVGDAAAVDVSATAALDEAATDEPDTDEPATDQAAEDLFPDDSTSDAEYTDALSAALDAFASHNLDDVDTELRVESVDLAGVSLDAQKWPLDDGYSIAGGDDAPVDEAEHNGDSETPHTKSVAERDEFEEGLVAQEWPDTTALSSRVATPAHGALPIVLDTHDDATSEAVELEVELEVEEEVEEEVEVELASAEVENLNRDHVDGDDADGDDADVAQYVALDEDPPLSATDIPWLLPPEAEREADEFFTLDEVASANENELVDVESDDIRARESETVETDAVEVEAGGEEIVNHARVESRVESRVEPRVEPRVDAGYASPDESEEADEIEPAGQPAAAAAFVTETMAELLVAQGFVGRAVAVYEELVVRRPYDAVLTFRLTELREMLAEEAPSTESEFQSEAAAEVDAEADIEAETETEAAAAEAAAAAAAATEAEAEAEAAAAAAETDALPRRSARELFASLAAMRVARRTPARGSVTVAMPTPADGLASLFGESALPADDLTARAMARAFGSGEGVEAGPSMFTPSRDTEAFRGRITPVSVPPVPSGPAFSFDRFFPDPATASTSVQATGESGASHAPESVVASGSGPVSDTGPSSAGADLAHFSKWLKGLSNS